MNTGLRVDGTSIWGDRPSSKLEAEFSIKGIANMSG